jgi:hypothetical protein
MKKIKKLLLIIGLLLQPSILFVQGFGDPAGAEAKNSFSWDDISLTAEKIVSVEIAIVLNPSDPWLKRLGDGGIKQLPKAIEVSVVDAKLREYLQQHLATSAHRPIRRRGTSITSQQIGMIRIATDQERFIPIQIWAEGFYLGDRVRHPDDRFYSWSLAQFVRAELEQNAVRMHQTNFDVLSGDRFQGRSTFPKRQLKPNDAR